MEAIDGSRGGYAIVATDAARERLRSGVLMGIGVGSGLAGGGSGLEGSDRLRSRGAGGVGGGRAGGGGGRAGGAGGDVVATRLAPPGGGGGGGWPLEDATCGSSIFPFRNSRN